MDDTVFNPPTGSGSQLIDLGAILVIALPFVTAIVAFALGRWSASKGARRAGRTDRAI
jgi:hypothetical protein